MDFFTRIDFMTLTPGNKSAGFELAVATKALEVLGGIAVSDDEWNRQVETARERLRNSGLLLDAMVEDCGFQRFEGTAVPRNFWVNRSFAASLSAEPQLQHYVRDPQMSQVLGTEACYSPHNVDSPVHALALHILVQAWSEYAWAKLTQMRQQQGGAHGS